MVYIKEYCKNCKSIQRCKISGIQRNPDGEPLFELVTCMKCKSTFSIPLKKKE